VISRRGARRTLIAFVLTTAAVALPSLVWFVAGSRSVANETRLLADNARDEARMAARRLADHLGARLEGLRVSEGKRPFYHFQPLYHDPKGAYDGPSVIPSPLSQGPTDPLILAHFQLDSSGNLSLPTLNEVDPDPGGSEFLTAQAGILELLESGKEHCVPAPPQSEIERRLDDSIPGLLPGVFPPGGEPEETVRVETMSQASWLQNLDANSLYAGLKGLDGADTDLPTDRSSLARLEATTVEFTVTPFGWRTVPLVDGGALLVALREVVTPAGTFIQGFAVCPDSVSRWIERAGFAARFAPAGSSEHVEAILPIGFADWAISVDPGESVVEAEAAGARLKREFLRLFWISVGTAWLVVLGVVGLVWQTERLATQRSRFAASAAHELKTPLAGIRMFGEMLAEGLGDPNRTQEYARRISSEADRLARVVSNVMGYTRLERGSLVVQCRPGDLAEAIRACVERQRSALETLGATVETQIPESLPASFDPDALCHILQNLLDNAEKYSRSSADRTIRVTLGRENRRAVLRVADRGPGVPEALRGKLFHPFARGDADENPAGLGLGLALSHVLAKAQGGRIALESGDGEGAVFRVTFRADSRSGRS
jgi:signal transduction histidine kinase